MTTYSSKSHAGAVKEFYDEPREDNNILKKALIVKNKQTKKLKENDIDLIKEEKIKWIECDLNTWGGYSESDSTPIEPYYIYSSDTEYMKGYFKGVSDLSHKDRNHFEEYLNDYFYYGYPNYQDVNSETYEDSECQLAFGSGSNTLTVIHPSL